MLDQIRETQAAKALDEWKFESDPLEKMEVRGNSKKNTFYSKEEHLRKNKDGTWRNHQGDDLKAPIGTPILAVMDGKIVKVYTSESYGECVILEFTAPDGKPYYGFYAHLSDTSVATTFKSNGTLIKAGTEIGKTGMTGSTAQNLPLSDAHLHFELRTSLYPGSGMADRINPFPHYNANMEVR